MPLAQLDPFMPLVDDLESFLGRLNVALKTLAASGQKPVIPPVLDLESLGVAGN